MIRTSPRAGKANDRRGSADRRDGGVLAVLGRLVLLVADALVDLFAVNSDFFRREHADADLVALDSEDRHGDVVPNHERLADASRQDQHAGIPLITGVS